MVGVILKVRMTCVLLFKAVRHFVFGRHRYYSLGGIIRMPTFWSTWKLRALPLLNSTLLAF